jgi:hypothetical protein
MLPLSESAGVCQLVTTVTIQPILFLSLLTCLLEPSTLGMYAGSWE